MKKTQTKYDYDLMVIGSGAGGGVAAHHAAKAGKSVALIEAGQMGGECPNIGCVPTKALLQAAEVYNAAKHGARFGIRGTAVGYNYPSIRAWKNLAVKRTGTYLGEDIYTDEGITVVHGKAFFIDSHTITVGNIRFSAKNYIIATGSDSVIPDIPGLTKAGFLTYKEAIDLSRPPKSLAIIGGGAIGCEFATLFASFGSKVYLIETASLLLNNEEPEAGSLLAERFRDDYSMSVFTGSQVEKVESFGAKKRLYLQTPAGSEKILVDEILVASGKQSVIDIGLENAGVEHEDGSITTNEYLQTSSPHIYAAGDCTGPFLFTHVATYQSRIVAHNLLHPRKKVQVNYQAVPRCVFTNPEIASVGATEAQLQAMKIPYKMAICNLSVIGRANTADFSDGFVKVLAHKNTDVLLGGCIMSPGAGEVVHELTLAIQNNLTAQAIAGTIHAFPTWSEALRVACSKLSRL